MNPLEVALRGKGPFNLARRLMSIGQNYGVTPAKMERALALLAETLHRFGCSGTFPTVAVVLARHAHLFQKYQGRGLEFAIHGYRHIDYQLLPPAEQLTQLELAKQRFERIGVQAAGFRGPYLHTNADTLAAIRRQNLVYDSSESLAWELDNGRETPAYRHVLGFYGAHSTADYPSLPRLEAGLVHIPYSLPDDEALANRLELKTTEQMNAIWLAVLRRSYQLGELFTLGLHPERTFFCLAPLTAVLAEARRLDPPVWIARLDEIAAWWQARAAAQVELIDQGHNQFKIRVNGPPELTILSRGLQLDVPTRSWAGGYRQILANSFTAQAEVRPWLGLSPQASPALANFLQQQGYITQVSKTPGLHAYYFEQANFAPEEQRPLLAQLESPDRPLVRLGRWPNGAQSALSITGDIDCLTLWDYAARFLGQ
jgi:peptidoglycan/xylan/chitin deacetylase (PgdA/CDA1 family)